MIENELHFFSKIGTERKQQAKHINRVKDSNNKNKETMTRTHRLPGFNRFGVIDI